MSHGLTHQALEHHRLERSWAAQVGDQFDEPYMHELGAFLRAEEQDGAEIYPPQALWFEALNRTAFQDVKVVILGQDPYHGQGQAHGLSFSVPPHVAIPPSLRNIYKELSRDVGIPPPTQGSLTNWAERGVLLLNATLTVTAGEAGSHQKKGWETFTDVIISRLNTNRQHLVFLLWGSYAQKKGVHIDQDRHQVLSAPHPSPLSAHRGFLGCQHFSRANEYLVAQGLLPIDWQP